MGGIVKQVISLLVLALVLTGCAPRPGPQTLTLSSGASGDYNVGVPNMLTLTNLANRNISSLVIDPISPQGEIWYRFKLNGQETMAAIRTFTVDEGKISLTVTNIYPEISMITLHYTVKERYKIEQMYLPQRR